MAKCLLALGSNLGERQATLDAAVDALQQTAGVEVLGASRWYRSEPVGGPEGQGEYLNGVVVIDTLLTPQQLLSAVHAIEARFGRVRNECERWAARTLDIDLLLYEDQVVDTPELVIPHPRMSCRRFVLEPAVEVAADWRHPLLEKTISELLGQLDRGNPLGSDDQHRLE